MKAKTVCETESVGDVHRIAVIYARVSSKDQEKEGYSIPSPTGTAPRLCRRPRLRCAQGIHGRGDGEGGGPHELRRNDRAAAEDQVLPQRCWWKRPTASTAT